MSQTRNHSGMLARKAADFRRIRLDRIDLGGLQAQDMRHFVNGDAHQLLPVLHQYYRPIRARRFGVQTGTEIYDGYNRATNVDETSHVRR